MSRAIRSMAVALTLLVLCSTATYAFPLGGRMTSKNLFTTLWERALTWLALDAPASLEGRGSLGEKAGSQMDPNGVPTRDVSGSMSDAGSQMDPDGYKESF